VEKVLVNQKQSQKQSESIFQRTEQQTGENDWSLTFKQDHSWFKSEGGFDLTQIPVHPALHTNQQIQCCAKDGSNCSCPKCRAEAESAKENENGEADEQQETEETQDEQNLKEPPVAEQGPEQIPGDAESVEAQQSETENTQSETSSTLIVEDDVTDLSEGQIRKTEFLQKLRSSICDTIGPVLATVGQTTEGCPYLNYWLDLHQEKDAAHIERTAKKYAPDVANAKTAEEYISIISQRALRAAEIWARTGKLSGVPEGVPTTLPNESPKEENPVQAKAKNGGVKKTDDPIAIKNKLGDGQPLSSDLRSRMESAFGINFSHVRTHTDSAATRLSNQVNARAFTVGNHIAFGNGEYQPGTLLGDTLIAHELAHTIQQSGAENSVDKLETGAVEYDSLERDADNAAVKVVGNLWSDGNENLKIGKSKTTTALRSGLRLQRCAHEQKVKTTNPSASGVPEIQNPKWSVAKEPELLSLEGCTLQLRDGTAPGMSFNANVHTPANTSGQVYFVQYVKPNRTLITCDGKLVVPSCAKMDWGIDTSWPDTLGSNYPVSGVEDRPFKTVDSPGVGSISALELVRVCTQDEFVTYLVFERPDKSLTPLAWVNWTFEAQAIRWKGDCPPTAKAPDCSGWQKAGDSKQLKSSFKAGDMHPVVALNRPPQMQIITSDTLLDKLAPCLDAKCEMPSGGPAKK
jgi:hypothetical protein